MLQRVKRGELQAMLVTCGRRKGLRIRVVDDLPTLFVTHRLMCRRLRPESVTLDGERRVPLPLQNLHHRLLDKPIQRLAESGERDLSSPADVFEGGKGGTDSGERHDKACLRQVPSEPTIQNFNQEPAKLGKGPHGAATSDVNNWVEEYNSIAD